MTFATRIRYWLPLVPLFGLLGASYWLNQQVQPETAKSDGSKRHDPDAIVENFSATKLNEEGLPSFIISAKKMLHYPDDDSTSLDAPRITLLSAERPTLHATATRGTLSSNGDEVFLYDDVEVLREASAEQDKLTLTTNYLHVIPDQNLANTDSPVTLVDAHNTVHATGMEMDNNTRTLKLLSLVTSVHLPIKN